MRASRSAAASSEAPYSVEHSFDQRTHASSRPESRRVAATDSTVLIRGEAVRSCLQPVSAAQGYDSIYLLAAAIKQAGGTDGPKNKAALEDLKEPVEGVVNILRVSRAVQSGVLSVNSHSSVHVETPFGGCKQSGLGRDLGMAAMEGYTELKNIYVAG